MECISAVQHNAEAMQEPDEVRMPFSGSQSHADSDPVQSRASSSRASLSHDDEDPSKMISQRWTSCSSASGLPRVPARHRLPPGDSPRPLWSPARRGAHIVSSRPRSPEFPRPVGPVAHSLQSSPSRGAMCTPDHVRRPPDTVRGHVPTLPHSNSTPAVNQNLVAVVAEKSAPLFRERVPPCQQSQGWMTPDQSNSDYTQRSCTPQRGSHSRASATLLAVTPGRCQSQSHVGFSGTGASAVVTGLCQSSSTASAFVRQSPRSLSPPRRACSLQFGSDTLAT